MSWRKLISHSPRQTSTNAANNQKFVNMAPVETLQGLTYATATQDINAATMERDVKVKRKVALDAFTNQIVAALVWRKLPNSEMKFTGMISNDPKLLPEWAKWHRYKRWFLYHSVVIPGLLVYHSVPLRSFRFIPGHSCSFLVNLGTFLCLVKPEKYQIKIEIRYDTVLFLETVKKKKAEMYMIYGVCMYSIVSS